MPVVVFVAGTIVLFVALTLVGRWLLARSGEQDHVPRADEVHIAIAPRPDGG